MTPARLASLLSPALPLAPLVLALAACGGDSSGNRGGSGAPLGFELAFAGTSAHGDAATPQKTSEVVALSPEQLAARLAEGHIRLIDVRTDAEVADGMIQGAQHIPLDRFDPATLDMSDGRKVVLYCRSGRRSAIAAEKLAAITGEPAEHLDGGMLAWEQAGQPIQTP